MRLTEEEAAMRNDAACAEYQWAIQHPIKVGTCLGAAHGAARDAALAEDIARDMPSGAMVAVDPEADPLCLRIRTP